MYNKVIEVSAGVLLNARWDVLVGGRLCPEEHYGKYVFPGGKVEDGETLEEALTREIKEETGLTILDKPVTLGYTDNDGVESRYKGVRFRVWFFLVPNWRGNILNGDKKNTASWEWVALEQLRRYPLVESMIDFFERVLPGKEHLFKSTELDPDSFSVSNIEPSFSGVMNWPDLGLPKLSELRRWCRDNQ